MTSSIAPRTHAEAPGQTPRARLVSLILSAVAAAFVPGTLALSIGDTTGNVGDLPFFIAIIAGVGSLAVIGAVLATRAPSNPIGPLFQVAAASMSVAVICSQYLTRGVSDLPNLPAVGVAGWLGQFFFIPAFAAVLSVFLLFPDGRPLSRRWRPALWVIWAGAVLGAIGTTFGSESFESDPGPSVANPFRMGPQRVLAVLSNLGGWAMVVAGILAIASVVLRYRRSKGEERVQLRWLAWAAGLILLCILSVIATGIGMGSNGSAANDVAFLALVISVLIGLPLATAVAVLRYRLYDLDIVIKKTAIYSIVAISLTGLYLALLGLAALAGLGTIPAVVVFALTFNLARGRARRLADRLVYGRRATPYEVLAEFSQRVGETYSIDDVLPRMTQLLAAGTGAHEARAWIREGGRLRSAAVAPAEAGAANDVALPDGDDLPSFGEGVHALPVTHQGELLGAITLTMAANDPMDATKERLAQGVASQAGLALRNVRLVEDLRASRRRIVAAQDERAKALERNIHDGAQQQLVALTVRLRIAEQLAERDPSSVAQTLRDLQDQATNALEDLRDLARGIYPPLLADKGLTAALEAQARKAALPVVVEAGAVGRHPQEIESTVYFCVLEALNNVAKYAQARSATIELSHTDGLLAFEVRDDGVGFDATAGSYGTGLQGMADRLDAVGGSFTVRSEPGRGAVVRGEIPVGEAAGRA